MGEIGGGEDPRNAGWREKAQEWGRHLSIVLSLLCLYGNARNFTTPSGCLRAEVNHQSVNSRQQWFTKGRK